VSDEKLDKVLSPEWRNGLPMATRGSVRMIALAEAAERPLLVAMESFA
jgi:hypothetical protein